MSRLPATLLADLAQLPSAAGAWLLLRHAERRDLPPARPGDDVPLTERGQAQALALGRTLAPRLGTLRCSAVLRCRQTATAIAAGANQLDDPQPDPLLGAPGPFVTDGERAWPLFVQHGAQGLARLQIRNTSLPGLRAVPQGCDLLIQSLLSRPPHPGRINVSVTHDLVIALLVAHLLAEDDPALHWPEFLEGVWLWREGPQLRGFFRGRALGWSDS